MRSGHLGGASLDVYHQEPLPPDDPLWTLPNVILTPHTSGFRQGHWDEVIDLFSENLRRYQRGEPVRFRVRARVGVLNKGAWSTWCLQRASRAWQAAEKPRRSMALQRNQSTLAPYAP